MAAGEGHLTVLSSILETLLCQASSTDDEGGTKTQAFINEMLNSQDSDGYTPLIVSCLHGHAECVRFLLANGADRRVADVKGNTALHYASIKGHLGVIFMLLSEFGTSDPEDLLR